MAAAACVATNIAPAYWTPVRRPCDTGAIEMSSLAAGELNLKPDAISCDMGMKRYDHLHSKGARCLLRLGLSICKAYEL